MFESKQMEMGKSELQRFYFLYNEIGVTVKKSNRIEIKNESHARISYVVYVLYIFWFRFRLFRSFRLNGRKSEMDFHIK